MLELVKNTRRLSGRLLVPQLGKEFYQRSWNDFAVRNNHEINPLRIEIGNRILTETAQNISGPSFGWFYALNFIV